MDTNAEILLKVLTACNDITFNMHATPEHEWGQLLKPFVWRVLRLIEEGNFETEPDDEPEPTPAPTEFTASQFVLTSDEDQPPAEARGE